MLKRVDVAVYDAIKKVNAGELSGGIHVYGLDNEGVGYSIDKYNRRLVNRRMEKVVNSFKYKIINGDIVVPDKR